MTRCYLKLVSAIYIAHSLFVAKKRSVTADRSLEDLFKHHADKWESETAHLSSTSQIMMHPSYQAILGMGDEVVPLLLRDMQQNRRSWFGALSYITKENPINPSDAGKMQRMIDIWVRWGRAKGLL